MIRAWQKVRKSFKFISAGFDQYGCLKADADNCRLSVQTCFHATVCGGVGDVGLCNVVLSFHPSQKSHGGRELQNLILNISDCAGTSCGFGGAGAIIKSLHNCCCQGSGDPHFIFA